MRNDALAKRTVIPVSQPASEEEDSPKQILSGSIHPVRGFATFSEAPQRARTLTMNPLVRSKTS